VDEPPHGFWISHVGSEGLGPAPLGLNLFHNFLRQPFAAKVMDGHIGSVVGEGQRYTSTDAAGATRHQSHFAC